MIVVVKPGLGAWTMGGMSSWVCAKYQAEARITFNPDEAINQGLKRMKTSFLERAAVATVLSRRSLLKPRPPPVVAGAARIFRTVFSGAQS
jgi:hypothetical protein